MPAYVGPSHLRYDDGFLQIWTNVAVSQVPIAAEIILQGCLNHPVVKTGIAAIAKQVQAYWKSISPVSTRPAHPYSKYSTDESKWDHPGDYRDSVKIRYWKNDKGHGARVYSNDVKAGWIEYGTARGMPELAPAARTREHFGGDHEHNPHDDVAASEVIGLALCRAVA